MQDLEGLGASRVTYLRANLGDLGQAKALAVDAVTMLRSWQRSPMEGDCTTTAAAGVVRSSILVLDCLINNAGVFDPEPRRSSQGYDSMLAVNVLTPFFVLTRTLLPCLVRVENTHIITMSSVSQSQTLPDLDRLAYTPSSSAPMGITYPCLYSSGDDEMVGSTIDRERVEIN